MQNKQSQIEIVVNGKKLEIESSANILALLKQLEVSQTAIAVELNCEIATRSEFESTVLRGGDVVEIVSLVGGG